MSHNRNGENRQKSILDTRSKRLQRRPRCPEPPWQRLRCVSMSRGIAGGAAFIDTTFLQVNITSGAAEPPRCRAPAHGGKSSDQRRTGRNPRCGSNDRSSPAKCIKPRFEKITNTDIPQMSVCTHTRTSPVPNDEPQGSLHTGREDTRPFRGNRHVSELSCCRRRPSQVTKSTSNFKSRYAFV